MLNGRMLHVNIKKSLEKGRRNQKEKEKAVPSIASIFSFHIKVEPKGRGSLRLADGAPLKPVFVADCALEHCSHSNFSTLVAMERVLHAFP